MLDVSRRSLLRGVLALAGTVSVTRPIDLFAAPQIPILWGDGINDDTDGLQALFDNMPVDIRNDDLRVLCSDGGVTLVNGVFRTTRTILIRDIPGRPIIIQSCKFRVNRATSLPLKEEG